VEPGSAPLEDSLGFCLVAGEVVEDHHVARLQRRDEPSLDIDVEDLAVSPKVQSGHRKAVLR
jgi:hypothetical protein